MAQVVLTEVQAGNPFTSASEAAFEGFGDQLLLKEPLFEPYFGAKAR
jgi:hypothetical protein